MTNRGSVLILAECYANTCVARKLKDILINKLNVSISVDHRVMYGRDRVIRDAHRIALKKGGIIIAIIDYETGSSRHYVDVNFKLEKLRENLFVGKSVKASNLLAVIFDPNVEAFICGTMMKCHEITVDQFKDKSICDKLEEILEDTHIEEVIEAIGERIIKLLDDELC